MVPLRLRMEISSDYVDEKEQNFSVTVQLGHKMVKIAVQST